VTHGRPDLLLVQATSSDVHLFRRAIGADGGPVNLEVLDDGAEALRRLRSEPPHADRHRPDLIILDLDLPHLDGRKLLAAIKGDPGLRLIPVVVFTHAHGDDVNAAYDLHANCYIRKPSDISEYMRAVQQCKSFWLGVVRLPSR
jgi:CheY-like chemotaxis protein